MKIVSHSEHQTLAFARRFASRLRGGDVVALVGDLGSGKTTFVRGLAAGFDIREPVRSPTFTLMHVHHIRRRSNVMGQVSNVRRLVHVDAYRLKNARELVGIGIEEYLEKKDTVVIIEWADRVRPIIRNARGYRMLFHHGKDFHARIIFYARTRNN